MKLFTDLETHFRGLAEARPTDQIKRKSGFSGGSGNEHVFYDLLEFVGPAAEPHQVQLLYYFHSYQECFQMARSGGIQLAKGKRAFIEEHLRLEFDSLTNLALEAIWFPACAFLEMRLGEGDKALTLLEKSVSHFRKFLDMGLHAAYGGILEQQLNMCRVYLRKGDVELALQSAGDILTDLDPYLRTEADPEDTFGYYFNAICWSALRLGPESLEAFLGGFVAACMQLPFLQGRQPAYLKLTETLTGGDGTLFLRNLSDSIGVAMRAPRAVQTLLWSAVIVHATVQAAPNKFSLGEMIAVYLKKKLGVETQTMSSVLRALFARQVPLVKK